MKRDRGSYRIGLSLIWARPQEWRVRFRSGQSRRTAQRELPRSRGRAVLSTKKIGVRSRSSRATRSSLSKSPMPTCAGPSPETTFGTEIIRKRQASAHRELTAHADAVFMLPLRTVRCGFCLATRRSMNYRYSSQYVVRRSMTGRQYLAGIGSELRREHGSTVNDRTALYAQRRVCNESVITRPRDPPLPSLPKGGKWDRFAVTIRDALMEQSPAR